MASAARVQRSKKHRCKGDRQVRVCRECGRRSHTCASAKKEQMRSIVTMLWRLFTKKGCFRQIAHNMTQWTTMYTAT